MKKNWWRLGLVLLLTLGLLYLFLRRVEWDVVWDSLNNVNLPLLLLAVALAPFHLVTRSLRWKYLLDHEKEGVSFYNRFAANAIGFTVSLTFPGRLGELIKPLYLAQKEKMPKGFVIGTAVVERIFDIFTMCLLLGLFMLAKPLYASIFHIDQDMYAQLSLWGIVGVALSSGLMLVTLALYFFKDQTLRIFRFFLRPFPRRLGDKVIELAEEFIQGMSFFKSARTLLLYTFWSFVVWLAIILFYWVFFLAYKVHVPYFFLIPFCFLVGVGASIPTPGMVGGFHNFSKLGMTSFFGIEANLAVAMTIVSHALQLVMTCLVGYVILWKEGLSLFQIKKMGEESSP